MLGDSIMGMFWVSIVEVLNDEGSNVGGLNDELLNTGESNDADQTSKEQMTRDQI